MTTKTDEQLHSKSAIAAELGWRDMRIAELEEIVTAVAHIGVDTGYGVFEMQPEHIEKARMLISGEKS